MRHLLTQGANIEGEEGEVKATQKPSGCGKASVEYSEQRIRLRKIFLCQYVFLIKKLSPFSVSSFTVSNLEVLIL